MTTVVADRATIYADAALERHPYFSWGSVIAGAVAAVAVSAMLVVLGAGFGLSFMGPVTDETLSKGALTAAAVYMFACHAFGFAVGGFIAGRLCGPVLESRDEEIFRSGAHGFTVWALAAILAALIWLAAAVAATSAAGNIASAFASPPQGTAQGGLAPTDYWVDTLFRAPQPHRIAAEARAEAKGIIAVNALRPGPMPGDDRARLAQLVASQTGMPRADAERQVDASLSRMHDDATKAAESARKAAAYTSIWTALALLFGLLVATGAAVLARLEDEDKRETVVVKTERNEREVAV